MAPNLKSNTTQARAILLVLGLGVFQVYYFLVIFLISFTLLLMSEKGGERSAKRAKVEHTEEERHSDDGI